MTLIIYLLLGMLSPALSKHFLINPIKHNTYYLLMLNLRIEKHHLSSPQGSLHGSLSQAIHWLTHYS